MRRTSLIALLTGSFALPGAILWACGGTLPGPRVCSERDPCDKGRTCVLGRCRRDKTMPISTKAPLLRFEAADFAWADGEVAGPETIGDRIVLGEAGHASAKLYLRFAISIPPAERVQRALLTLTPLSSCTRKPGRMALEVAHILEPWSSAAMSSGDRPKLDIPMRAGETSVTPARPLRIDVTELVRAWAEHKKRYHGLALMAAGDSATGACFTSGLTAGQGPALHVYLWPDEPDGGADAGDADAGDAGDDAGDGGS